MARKQRLTEIILFLILLACYSYFLPRWSDWNQNSRINLVLAIVDQGVLHIDDYYQNTGDYAFYQGHYYSDKAPGTAFLGVPAYAVFKVATRPFLEQLIQRIQYSVAFEATLDESGSGLLSDKVRFAIVQYWLSLICVSAPSAMLGVILYRFLGHLTSVEFHRIGITLAYGLGTLAFPYSGLFIGHQLAAALLFTAFYLLFTIGQRETAARILFIAGLLLGYATITEYEAGIIAAIVFLYGWHKLTYKPQVLYIVTGGLLPGLLAMAYNFAIFKTVLPVAYKYSVLFPEHFSTGLLGFSYPRLEAIWGMSFSSFRGLFTLFPVLLLSIPGMAIWLSQRRFRTEAYVVLGSVTLYFLAIASSEVWFGGHAVGPRYLSVMIPFMVAPIAFFLNHNYGKAWLSPLFSGMALLSIGLTWTLTISGQQFPGYTYNPLFEYALPRLQEGDVARNLGMILRLSGLESLVPLIAINMILVILLWSIIKRTEPSIRTA